MRTARRATLSCSSTRSCSGLVGRASGVLPARILRNFALELRNRNPQAIVAGLHPGTVDTSLSRPFQRNVSPGKLFSPEQSAGYMLGVLERLTPDESGRLFAWDGQEIPF